MSIRKCPDSRLCSLLCYLKNQSLVIAKDHMLQVILLTCQPSPLREDMKLLFLTGMKAHVEQLRLESGTAGQLKTSIGSTIASRSITPGWQRWAVGTECP